MTDHGDLYMKLDQLQQLLDARWIALAWRSEDGTWNRHLRGRDNPLPQAQRRFLEQLESMVINQAGEQRRRDAWKEFLAAWRAESGYFASFDASNVAPAYYAIVDPGTEERHPWADITLRALADAAIDYERAHMGVARQQAVMESAASLLTAASEDDVIPRGLGLALRLVEAGGAAFFKYNEEQQSFNPTFVRAEGPLHDALRAEPCCLEQLCAEAMRSGKAQWQHPGGDTPHAGDTVQSAVAVPMYAHEGFQGILVLAGTDRRDFDELDVNTLTLFGRQLAGVVENLRLLRRLRVTNQELSDTQAQLMESARLSTLAEMAGGVAHDFNNILGALLGRVQLLQTRVSDPNALQGLSKMERLIGEGESTVKRLQEAARVRTSEPAGPQTLDDLVRSIFTTVEFALKNQAQIDDRQVTWKTDFKPAGILVESADRLRGSLRVFLRALSARAPVGSQITIQTDCDDISNLIRFIIRLPSTYGSANWQWNSMAEAAHLQATIIELGGHIDTTCDSDAVPCYTVRFSPPPPEKEDDTVKVHSFRVLVVDDDSEVRDVLEELLRMDGHQVTSAVDGTQALELFAPDKYDFVFTDLGMPGISGWQVAESIKKDAPQMPVVMVTGWGAQLDPERVKSSGVDKVLTKPFQWVAVRETLTELTTGKA